jgi:hypothetical protein
VCSAPRSKDLTLWCAGSIIPLFSLIGIAVAGCSDEADVAPDDPGESRGPTRFGVEETVEIATALELLPLAKRVQTRIGESPIRRSRSSRVQGRSQSRAHGGRASGAVRGYG